MIKKIITLVIIMINHHLTFANDTITNNITPVSYFVDHVFQLNMMKENLSKYNKTSVVGTSGIGKTQLVRMYVQENKSKYDIIWFFDCNLDINSEFVRLARKINIVEKNNVISEEEHQAKQEVMNYLSEKSRWLLVFDNNKTKQNYNILDIINWEHNGNVIFSSQENESLPHVIKLTAFNKKDAIELANNILENKGKDLPEFLAEEFKGYPVLIVQGAQLLNNIRGLSREIYKQKILESADKIKLNVELAIKSLTPSAKKLIYKIALINNQGFSKKLVSIIADDKSNLDSDLYQLSKLMLISNIDQNEKDPIFEMHDIIAIKILELSTDIKNKERLEDIIVRLMKAMPESVHEGHIFRTSKTIHENLEIIFMNIEKYKPNLYKLMEFNLVLATDYINTLNYDKAESLVNWFEKQDTKGVFKLLLMSTYEKYIYSRYLGAVGGYYRLRNHDHNLAISYFLKAKQVLDTIEGYYDIKSNTIYQLSISQIAIGNLEEATKNIQVMETMFADSLVKQSESGLVHLAKAKLLTSQGDFVYALKEVNKDISESIKYGLKEDDLIFSSTYLLKSEILNYLQKYDEGLRQAKYLYKMHKSYKDDNHEFFGRIYVQISRSKLGLKAYDSATKYAKRAIKILSYNKNEVRFSSDIELAKAYLIYADILSAMNKYSEAIFNYEIAEGIYKNAYTNHVREMQDIVYTTFAGAKAAYKKKDKFWYKHFYNSFKSIVNSKSDKIKELDILSSDWK